MAANLPPEKRAELRRRAWDLAVSGRTQHAIARDLGVSQAQVSRHLARARRAAWDGLAEEARTYAILSLRQADRLYELAIEGLARSLRPRRKKATKGEVTTSSSPDGPATAEVPAEFVRQVERSDGDPRWIAQALRAIGLRMAILERFAPPGPAEGRSGPDLAAILIDAEARFAAYRPEIEPPPTPPAEGTPE